MALPDRRLIGLLRTVLLNIKRVITMERKGFENKRNCSECGQRACMAYVNDRLNMRAQRNYIIRCQDTHWKPIDRR